MFVFALLAFARPRRAQLDIVLTFEPNFLLAWFFLSPTGISRLSLGYIAANALLAADGMDVVATWIASGLGGLVGSRESGVGAAISDTRRPTPDARKSRGRFAVALQALFAAVIIGRYI